MAHRQSLGAESTSHTLRSLLPGYTSRAQSRSTLLFDDASSTLPPSFSDNISLAPSYNTNSAAIANIWDLQPLESNPDVYEFAVGSGSDPEDEAWLKWFILARSSPNRFDKPKDPRYVGGDDVASIVSLKLPEPKHISSMTITLRGRYITGSMLSAEGDYAFLKTIETIDISGVRQESGKIPAGNYEYDIRISFPTEVNLLESLTKDKVKGKGPALPETSRVMVFSPQTTRDIQASIEYDLVLTVEHGKLFKRSTKLRTRILYTPIIIPDPPSILRQIAYQNGDWAPDPARDPVGWSAISPLVLRGDFEGTEEVVKYTVFLANPLCYTRGSFVPVHLEIACENLRLLEALSKRECHDIHLVCETATLLRPEFEMPQYLKAVAAQSSRREDSHSNLRGYTFPSERIPSMTKTVSDISFADDAPIYRHREKSWPSISLKGEIHLSRSLLPSSDFLPFSVHYKVQINPPTDASRRFIPAPVSMSRASSPITIATQFALGVERPVKMLRGNPSSRRRDRGVGQFGADTTAGAVLNRLPMGFDGMMYPAQ